VGRTAKARGYHTEVLPPSLPEDQKVAAIRELLPATAAGIYLNTGTSGPIPSETALAMSEQEERELRTGRGHPDTFPEMIERMGEARGSLAALLATDLDTIALTHSTSDGMNAVVAALPWRAGDRVLTTQHEHPGGLGPLIAVRDRFGVEIGYVDIGDGEDADRTVAAFRDALDARTRAVVFSHVLWTTGAVLPVDRIAAAARDAGAAVIVDAAQSVGAIEVRPDELGVDALAMPGQKWLLGPEGMGGLWAGERAWEWIPAAGGWFAFESIDRFGVAAWQPNARRFEPTNFHRPSVTGLARSLGWLAMSVGLPWAFERGPRMARGAAARLAAIPGVTVVTPREQMASLVSFRIAGWTAEAAYEELSSRIFAILRHVAGVDLLRISVGFWSTDEELDRFAEGVELLARHTPDTLPPRRHLAVLGADGRPIG
jgi:L-cysteine/cystine lyase